MKERAAQVEGAKATLAAADKVLTDIQAAGQQPTAEQTDAKAKADAQLKEAEQVLTRHIGATLSGLEEAAELGLANAIDTAHLLLFAQLETVVTDLAAAHHVHAWRGWALLERALLRIATRALQEELRALSTALAADWSGISTHASTPLDSALLWRTAAIVWQRRHVGDCSDVEARGL